MKKWIIKIALLPLMVLLTITADGQTGRKNFWPDHLKLQYAGGIGFFSVGSGYTNKKQWLEGDLQYGYVPKSIGGVTIHLITAKASFFPLKPFGKSIEFKWPSLGVLANYTFGKQYFGFTPENYPFGYYSRPTAFRAAAFIGGQINKKLNGKSVHAIGLYTELITYDTELISYIDNTRTLDWDDILNLGIGIRLSFK